MRRPRRNHTAVFKAKVAIAALKGCQSARNFDHVSALNFDQATETISGA